MKLKCPICKNNNDLNIIKSLSDKYGFYREVECIRCEITFYSYGMRYRRKIKEKFNYEMDKNQRNKFNPKEDIKEVTQGNNKNDTRSSKQDMMSDTYKSNSKQLQMF